MNEEAIADSGEESGIDMEAAMDEISESLFDSKPEEVEEVIEDVERPEEIAAKDTEEPKEEIKEEEGKLNELPQSWKKEMQEKWEGVDPETQEYFLQREAQMAKGDDLRQEDATYGRTMRDVLEPFVPTLEQNGINPQEMVKNLLNAQFRLANGTPEERTQLIQQLAQSYGVTANGETPQANPEVKALQDRFSNIENHLNASQQRAQQEQNEKIQSEVVEFASDPEHALFDEVSEEITMFIKSGQSLDEAYKSAIWQNPVTRQKEIDRMNKEASEKSLETAKQESEKARKAKSTNVKGRDTNKAPTEALGTMEDTMRETFRELNS